MESSCTYRVYCSKCNKDQKKKMSWSKYLYYMTVDGKSKGYHDIDTDWVADVPNKCIFGHEINTKRTKIIIRRNSKGGYQPKDKKNQ